MFEKPLYFLALLIFCSCGASKVRPDEKDLVIEKSTDEIVFVVFKMTKNTPGNSIEILSTTKANGKMKPEMERPINSANFLTLEIFENDKPILTRRLEHPLLKNVEYLTDNNEFASKEVDLEEAEFFIRIQRKGVTIIKISETLKNKTKNELQTFTI